MTRTTCWRMTREFILLLALCLPATCAGSLQAFAQQETYSINISAGPLASALNKLAIQTGIQIGFDDTMVAGMRTQGLSGTYTIDGAFGRILSGTGLQYRFNDARTISLLAGDGAAADLPAPEDGVLLDKIVVRGSGGVIEADGYVGLGSATGTKVDTPFLETPQSISSVTETQLQDRKPKNLLDAIAYTPGARVNLYGSDPRYDSFYVRGFNLSNTGVFRDNLRQPVAGYGYFLTEPYETEGISILRGPSSALYGATGAGGLYNVISKRPTEIPLHELQIQTGTDNRYQGQFDFSGPVLDSDTFFYRLTGLARNADTEFESVSDDRYLLAPAVTWEPGANTKLTVLGEISRSDSGGNPAYYNDYYGHVSEFEAGDPSFGDLIHNQARVGWEFEHRFNDMFAVRQNARFSTQDIDAKYVYTYNGTQHALDPALVDRGAGYEAQKLDAFVIDNQLEADVATGEIEHTMLFGLDVSRVNYRSLSGGATIPPLNTANPNYGGNIATPAFTSRTDQEQLQVGVYAQDQLRYGPVALTLTGRHDWVSMTTDNTDLSNGSVSETDQDDREFSFRGALTYLTSFGLAPYVSYSTAFSPNVGWNKTTNAAFKPTKSTQEEIGLKYLLPNRNVMLTAAIFNIDQTDGLFYEVVNGVNTQVQRGKLRSRGIELEATGGLSNGLSFTGAYTYTDMKILEGPAATVDNYVSSVPRHMASLWLNYEVPENSAFHGLGMGAGARFTGSSYGDDQNTLKNDARVYFDASLSFDFAALNSELDGLKFQVNGTNIFDRRDTTCTSGYCYLDPGMSVIASLRYRW